jgi:diguanylate cyclase (GGDEF)-like protein
MSFPSPEIEDEYRQERFAEYRAFSMRVGLAGALLTIGLWLRDFADDPAGAHRTFEIRFLMAAGVLVYVASLWRGVRRELALLAGYAALVVIEFVVLLIWERLAGGYRAGFPGYMYIYLLTPLMVMPFTLSEVLPLLVVIGLVPNLQAALGMAPGFPLLSFNVLVWPACAIVAFSMYEFDRVIRRLFVAQRQVMEQAMRDPLTQLGNRRFFEERAKAALARVRRRARPLSLLMIDIDNFKAINDHHGHPAGDEVLRALAGTLAASMRAGDDCGRLGGEEFAVVLPDEDREGAAASAERLRATVELLGVDAGSVLERIGFTISIGVSTLPQDGYTLEELLRHADERLYRAKEGGRNRVIAAG